MNEDDTTIGAGMMGDLVRLIFSPTSNPNASRMVYDNWREQRRAERATTKMRAAEAQRLMDLYLQLRGAGLLDNSGLGAEPARPLLPTPAPRKRTPPKPKKEAPVYNDQVTHAYDASPLEAPKIGLAFLREASDQFVRTGLYRIAQRCYPEKDHKKPMMLGMTEAERAFLCGTPHGIKDKALSRWSIWWHMEEERLLVGPKGEALSCYLPECRPCSVGLYFFLFPQMVQRAYQESMQEFVEMMATEKLRQWEVVP